MPKHLHEPFGDCSDSSPSWRWSRCWMQLCRCGLMALILLVSWNYFSSSFLCSLGHHYQLVHLLLLHCRWLLLWLHCLCHRHCLCCHRPLTLQLPHSIDSLNTLGTTKNVGIAVLMKKFLIPMSLTPGLRPNCRQPMKVNDYCPKNSLHFLWFIKKTRRAGATANNEWQAFTSKQLPVFSKIATEHGRSSHIFQNCFDATFSSHALILHDLKKYFPMSAHPCWIHGMGQALEKTIRTVIR